MREPREDPGERCWMGRCALLMADSSTQDPSAPVDDGVHQIFSPVMLGSSSLCWWKQNLSVAGRADRVGGGRALRAPCTVVPQEAY